MLSFYRGKKSTRIRSISACISPCFRWSVRKIEVHGAIEQRQRPRKTMHFKIATSISCRTFRRTSVVFCSLIHPAALQILGRTEQKQITQLQNPLLPSTGPKEVKHSEGMVAVRGIASLSAFEQISKGKKTRCSFITLSTKPAVPFRNPRIFR